MCTEKKKHCDPLKNHEVNFFPLIEKQRDNISRACWNDPVPPLPLQPYYRPLPFHLPLLFDIKLLSIGPPSLSLEHKN